MINENGKLTSSPLRLSRSSASDAIFDYYYSSRLLLSAVDKGDLTGASSDRLGLDNRQIWFSRFGQLGSQITEYRP